MKKAACMFLVVVSLFGASLSKLRAQQTAGIVGSVVDTQGKPIAGVRIIAQDPSGSVVAETFTNAEGQYSLEKLPAGQYNLTLDPVNTGLLGETVVVSLIEEGLTVNWILSDSTGAVAFASAGVMSEGIFGLGAEVTGFLGFLFLGGTMFGLGAAISASGVTSGSQ